MAWGFAVPTSDTIAKMLVKVICKKVCPKILNSDWGTNVLSKAIEGVYSKLGIKHITITAFTSSSNGKIEKQHVTLNSALAQLVNSSHNDWDENLDFALLDLHSAVYSFINETPFFVTYGRDIKLPYTVLGKKHPINYNKFPWYCKNLIKDLSITYKMLKIN